MVQRACDWACDCLEIRFEWRISASDFVPIILEYSADLFALLSHVLHSFLFFAMGLLPSINLSASCSSRPWSWYYGMNARLSHTNAHALEQQKKVQSALKAIATLLSVSVSQGKTVHSNLSSQVLGCCW